MTVFWYCEVAGVLWVLGDDGPRCDTYGEPGFGIDTHASCGERYGMDPAAMPRPPHTIKP